MKFHLNTPSQTENLELIRNFVSKIAEKAGFEETKINDIELAVDEACTNVVKHAYDEDSKRKDIDVIIEIRDGKFIVIVSDRGKGFNPHSIKELDLSKAGGLGIHLMKILMDEVQFDIKPGVRTRVKMVKYMSKERTPRIHA